MPVNGDELNAARKADAFELRLGALPAVQAVGKGDAINAIKGRPAGGRCMGGRCGFPGRLAFGSLGDDCESMEAILPEPSFTDQLAGAGALWYFYWFSPPIAAEPDHDIPREL